MRVALIMEGLKNRRKPVPPQFPWVLKLDHSDSDTSQHGTSLMFRENGPLFLLSSGAGGLPGDSHCETATARGTGEQVSGKPPQDPPLVPEMEGGWPLQQYPPFQTASVFSSKHSGDFQQRLTPKSVDFLLTPCYEGYEIFRKE